MNNIKKNGDQSIVTKIAINVISAAISAAIVSTVAYFFSIREDIQTIKYGLKNAESNIIQLSQEANNRIEKSHIKTPSSLNNAVIHFPSNDLSINLQFELQGKADIENPHKNSLWIVAKDPDGDLYPIKKVNLLQNGTFNEPITLSESWNRKQVWLSIVKAPQSLDSVFSNVGDDGMKYLPSEANILAENMANILNVEN